MKPLADNFRMASSKEKHVLAMDHCTDILENGDRQKGQAGAEKTAGNGELPLSQP